ncbi:MAG: hypothetical protein V3R32_04040, partial [Nitrosomonadaceae bacterium]
MAPAQPIVAVDPPAPFLPSPGKPQISWARWYEDWTDYLLAAGLDEESNPTVTDKRRRAILVRNLGDEGRRILSTLGEKLTLALVAQGLKDYFEPRVYIRMERFNFHQRAQIPGEPVLDFVTCLRELVIKCNYGNLTDDLVVDQLVEKTNNPRIREKL